MKKITQDEIEKFYESNGCRLLEQYKNCYTTMDFICRCGRTGKKMWSHFKNGDIDCRHCINKRMGENNQKYYFEDIKKLVEENGRKLLDVFKVKGQTKVKFQCLCGNISETFLSSIVKGSKCCCKCSKKRKDHTVINGIKISTNIEALRKFSQKLNCILISNKYVESNHKLEFICKCNNVFNRTLKNFVKYPMCHLCARNMKNINFRGEKHPLWKKNREEVARNRKFHILCRNMVKRCLKDLENKNRAKSYDLLGYSNKELIDHIENHSNWPMLKGKPWHLDHIYPITAFIEYGISDLKIIHALENLQPLEKHENLTKYAKYDKQLFEQYLDTRGVRYTTSG